MNLSKLNALQLLNLNVAVIEELKERGVIRTNNAPTGGYAEWLFCQAFGWTLAANSQKGYDATDKAGKRHEIKARRITKTNGSRQLSALRDLKKKHFDVLSAVLFNEDFTVKCAALIPHSLVLNNSTRVNHTNSHKFVFNNDVWEWPGVRNVTKNLQRAQNKI